MNKRLRTEEEITRIIDSYKNGISIKDLCEGCDVDSATLYKLLDKNRIPRREPSKVKVYHGHRTKKKHLRTAKVKTALLKVGSDSPKFHTFLVSVIDPEKFGIQPHFTMFPIDGRNERIRDEKGDYIIHHCHTGEDAFNAIVEFNALENKRKNVKVKTTIEATPEQMEKIREILKEAVAC